MHHRAISRPSTAFLLLSICLAGGCDSITYLDGHPPSDAQLAISEVAIDTARDSTGRTVHFSFRADWKIDSADFALRSYRLGLVFQQTSPPWLPVPRSSALAIPEGSARDTISCHADTCSWMFPIVHVFAVLPTGDYLSVAQDTISFPGKTTP